MHTRWKKVLLTTVTQTKNGIRITRDGKSVEPRGNVIWVESDRLDDHVHSERHTLLCASSQRRCDLQLHCGFFAKDELRPGKQQMEHVHPGVEADRQHIRHGNCRTSTSRRFPERNPECVLVGRILN